MLSTATKRLRLDKIADILTDELRGFRVEVLVDVRSLLQKILGRVSDQIRALGGAGQVPRESRGTVVRRRRAGGRIHDKIVEAMRTAGGPVKSADLPELIQKAGYQTVSDPAHLLTAVYHTLADQTFFKKVDRGVYILVGAPLRKETLADKIVAVMRTIGGPVQVRVLVERMRDLGYHGAANPESFRTRVQHTLADKTLFRKMRTGVYALATQGEVPTPAPAEVKAE